MTDLFLTQSFLVAAAGVSATKFMLVIAVIFSIFVLPFILGNLIGRALNLKELAGRISLVLCVTFCGLAPFIWPFINYPFQVEEYETQKVTWDEQNEKYKEDIVVYREKLEEWNNGGQLGEKPIKPEELKKLLEPVQPALDNIVRKGIDLAGGTNLVFQVEFDKLEKKIDNRSAAMDQMIGAIIRRINPSGTEEVVVRKVGDDRIEVIIPGADQDVVQQKKNQMTRLGSLEFGVLATGLFNDHDEAIGKAQASSERTVLNDEKQVIARWHDVAIDRKNKEIKFKGADGESQIISRVKKGANGEEIKDSAGNTVRQYLVIYAKDDERVTGKFLTRAGSTKDQSGNLAVSFNFDSEGAYRFRQLTTIYKPRPNDNIKYHLAVLLDGEIHSAPTINEPIGASGQISGRYTQQEVQELVNVLNAGALEVPINPVPVQEMTISPLLGADVIDKGLTAIMIAGGVVLIFMIVYYLFAGFVADLCLVLNIILVMGAMVMINAAFTLPGLAGIVLTIGMAVDANVLIFERIREEINRGSSMRMAIQNGFDRAFTTIVDANVTTLLTAIVLYMIGTDQVRGFAVTLFIGIVMSMFTSLYVGRLVFDIVEQKRWVKKINMLSVVGKTSVDFISKRHFAAVVSFVLIAGGFVALFARGSHMLDIDFTGGTMLTFEVEQPTTSAKVRKILEEKFGTAITVEQLAIDGDATSEEGKLFRVRTTMRDSKSEQKEEGEKQETVSHMVDAAFKKSDIKLLHTTVKIGGITEIPRGNVAVDQADAANRFAGGQQVTLEFNNAVNRSVAIESLTEQLEKFTREDKKTAKYDDVNSSLSAAEVKSETGDAPDSNRYLKWEIKTLPVFDAKDFSSALTSMQKKMSESPTFEGVNSFDSAVASEMKRQAYMAMFASLIAIIGYIWFRFQRITFGLAAVVALVHDVLIVLGMVALANWLVGGVGVQFLKLEEFKINLPMIAAFLTIVGYSLNDTIVVFDRIREVRGKNPDVTVDMLNLSLNQTLSRTILTSLTTFVVVAILYFFGGEGIHGFAYCLVLGVIVGTYSSIYVASPVLLWLMKRDEKIKEATA